MLKSLFVQTFRAKTQDETLVLLPDTDIVWQVEHIKTHGRLSRYEGVLLMGDDFYVVRGVSYNQGSIDWIISHKFFEPEGSYRLPFKLDDLFELF